MRPGVLARYYGTRVTRAIYETRENRTDKETVRYLRAARGGRKIRTRDTEDRERNETRKAEFAKSHVYSDRMTIILVLGPCVCTRTCTAYAAT